ncbi:MAG: ATP-binding protein [Candidatus Roizmanbacteria bacterium]|nr:ATP-binding protein [Candidatus Roizmanbacteria bacterium]
MRYLNKIIFINSAAIKYAEIHLNGNVHFTGTQGVGKSTILRAILFFYNANQRKLGVPTGPTNKSFAEWYFPYTNSFVIYEVQKETGAYCVLTFKSQNRVCFRFFDGAYDIKYFIGSDGNAFESWEKSRAILDADRRYYSHTINNFDDYRDIIYGSNERQNKLNKYALLESKQYKNIPRTIQNVFLNSKLEADLIKQTIIESMNEEDTIITLQSYTHHLKDFETQLSDIEKFSYPSVRKHGDNAANVFAALKYLEKEKPKLARQLNCAWEYVNQRKPLLSSELMAEEEKQQFAQEKIMNEQLLYQKQEKRLLEEISVVSSKLKEAKEKREEYERINISEIIKRVSAKNDLEAEKQNLQKEQELLTSKSQEITQKYNAILMELKNCFDNYQNNKDGEKNRLRENYHNKKENMRIEYEQLITEIKRNHKRELEGAKQEVDEKQKLVFNLKNKKADTKHKRFYEDEIGELTKQIDATAIECAKGKNDIELFKQKIEFIKKKWELEKQSAEENSEREKEKIDEKAKNFKIKLLSIDQKIENSKESFFGWLNENYPEWEETIGKVCDENVLFQSKLFPELISGGKDLIYGIKINLKQIDRTTKTIEDYEHDRTKLTENIEELNKDHRKLNVILREEIDRIVKRNLPKIKQCEDSVKNSEYETDQALCKKQRAEVAKSDFVEKAKKEKQLVLNNIVESIGKATELELEAKENVHKIENQIERQIKTKESERDKSIEETHKEIEAEISKIDTGIITKKEVYESRNIEVSLQKKQELNNKGVDTERLSAIDKKMSEIEAELGYIENNRDKVAEYNKDKRELFDRINEFNNKKQLLEQKLKQEIQEHHQKERSLKSELETISNSIKRISTQLEDIKEDLEEFSRFELSEVYPAIEPFMGIVEEISKTEYRCRIIIEQIKEAFYKTSMREVELKETIDRFLGNFSEQNIFRFKTNLISIAEYMKFSEELMDFIDEDKISEFERRVNERFASIITMIGKQTTDLISKTGEVQNIVKKINADFIEKNFVGAVKKIELRVDKSANNVVVVLKLIKEFNDENGLDFGEVNLFSTQNREINNKKAIELLKQLVKEIDASKRDYVSLSDSFELKFRVKENQNDTDWVEKLSNVGSDGTDVLVKAMVNIMLLNVFKEGASKRFKDFRLHCMMDEIGKLHPDNIKGIMKFANDRNILLINGSPIENTPLSYKHIYIIRKDSQGITKVNRYLSNFA